MTSSCGRSRTGLPTGLLTVSKRLVGRLLGSMLLAGTFLSVMLLSGCMSIPMSVVPRSPSEVLVAPADAPLAAMRDSLGLGPEQSGAWPLVQAAFALDARLAMIRHARRSIDVQSYLIADDSIGRLIMRELRDAALRGVRVRLLVDDLYTIDTDRLLLGLAATPNVEVRLFNPIVTDRNSAFRRLLTLAIDFRHLNHRMHNKLMIADGAAGIVGGRNLADEYFLRGASGNFIDFDLLVTGAVVTDLGHWFDLYWNSEQVFPAVDVVRAAHADVAPPATLRAEFDRVTRGTPPAVVRTVAPPASAANATPVPLVAATPETVPPADFFDQPAFSVWLAQHRFPFLKTEARAFADSPTKIDPEHHSLTVGDTLTHRFLNMLGEARSDVLLFSPYFIPGDEAMARLHELRDIGVRVRVVTNSLAVSDEPLVSVRFERHQTELLKMGVELYELSSNRLKLDRSLRGLLGTSTGRLHAKLAFVDRKTVFVGSMNLDPRSSSINTEIGVRVESPMLARMIVGAMRVDSMLGVYEVKLNPDGQSVRWTATNENGSEEIEVDPDTSFWQRMHFLFLALFVPENEL